MWHLCVCVCSKMCKVFSLPSAFYKMSYHSTNTLYVRLPYHTTADKVNEFVLGRFMLALGIVLGVSRWFRLFSVIRYTDLVICFLFIWS